MVDRVNVQMCRDFTLDPLDVQLVDFGHYEFRERFERPLLSSVGDRLLNWGGLLMPENPVPDEACRRARLASHLGTVPVPTDCRNMAWQQDDGESSGIEVAALRFARDWCRGNTTPDDIADRLTKFVRDLPCTTGSTSSFNVRTNTSTTTSEVRLAP